MKIKRFEDFIFGNYYDIISPNLNEKLGIIDEVETLSNELFNKLINIKNGKKYQFVIDDDIINIEVNNEKLEKINAYALFIPNKQNNNIAKILIKTDLKKNYLFHEIAHFIRYKKLGNKIETIKRNLLNSTNKTKYYINNFETLIEMIYLSDESEMNSFIHEIYYSLKKEYDISLNKNDFFQNETNFDFYKNMINYNIFEDLKDINIKQKQQFFNILSGFITTNNNFFNKIKHYYKIIFNKYNDNEIDINIFMNKLQNIINKKGYEYQKRIHKLYDLI